jgi:hypothetical protein
MSFQANGQDGVVTVQQTVEGWLEDIKSQIGRIPEGLSVLKGIIGGTLTEGVVDDRKYAPLPSLDLETL